MVMRYSKNKALPFGVLAFLEISREIAWAAFCWIAT